jgi:glucokinase
MKHVIAMDLGGTKILAAIVNEKGKIIQQVKVPTQVNAGWPAMKKQIVSICRDFMNSGYKITAIGVGSAGPLHAKSGVLLDPTNFGWKKKKIHFVRDLSKVLKLPIVFDNDAVAAVLGERWLRHSPANTICITLGTGLGVGVLIDDKVLRGRSGLHSECGHMIIRPQDHDAHCGCGAPGCAEGFLSGVNFVKWVSKKTNRKFKDAKELVELAKGGDIEISRYFAEYAELMAQFLCVLTVCFYPSEIVFSGSFAEATPLFLPQTE